MFGKNIPVKIEKADTDGKLGVHSIFYTIQGEGPYAGLPAVFIRLADCSLACSFCDTDFALTERLSPEEICNSVSELLPKEIPFKFVVITGGEPFLQYNLALLCMYLTSSGYSVQIETSGSVCTTARANAIEWMKREENRKITIICSPKTSRLAPAIIPLIDCYKYVLRHDNINEMNGLPLKAYCGTGNMYIPIKRKEENDLEVHYIDTPIWVMPCDEHDEALSLKNIEAVKNSCLKFGYRLCLQLHKLVGVD